jgi:hypothetical protein
MPAWLDIRELQYTISARGMRTRNITIATTLLDPVLYPAEAIAELYNVRWQVKAAQQQGVTPDRISFIDSVRWLLTAASGEAIPRLVVNRRRHRQEPRVAKDRGTNYPRMTKPRKQLREALETQGEMA